MQHPTWRLLGIAFALMSCTDAEDVAPSSRISFQVDDYRSEPQLRFDDTILNDCIQFYDNDNSQRCVQSEDQRIQANLKHFNTQGGLTAAGFQKDLLPKKVSQKVQRYWSKNKGKWREESWPIGDTTTNHWSSPTYRVGLDESSLRGSSKSMKESIIETTKERLENWTGEKLRLSSSPTSIRVYSSGATVSPHAAQLPQVVASAIINVAQDLNEAWPMEVITGDGTTRQVTLLPGEMLLIESSSIIQGYPLPLKGKYAATMVVHFELSTPASAEAVETIEDKVHSAAQSGNGAQLTKLMRMDTQLAHLEDANGWTPLHEASRAGHADAVRLLLSYAADPNHRTSGGRGGTALYYAAKYQGRSHPVSSILFQAGGNIVAPGSEHQVNLVSQFHTAVHEGQLQTVSDLLLTNKELVLDTDKNGWTALQFAVRAGHLELVKLLFKNGAELNHRTNAGKGSSTLYLAEKYHGENHQVTAFLRNNGGHSVASQLEL
jgi:prolyl 4-hydroxylase